MYIFLTVIILLLMYCCLIAPRFSKRRALKMFHGVWFAHRGLFSKEEGVPENSMAAMQNAVAHGYGMEFDVHLTKDGQLVVFHDNTLNRMCGVDGVVEELTYEELKQCRLDDTDETIPLLKDVLACVNGRVPLLIELKLPSEDMTLCEKAYKILRSYDGAYLIESFNTLGIYWFRKHAPEVLRGQLASNLTRTRKGEPWIACLLTRFLLLNAFGKPDFIAYKLLDSGNISLRICKHLFRTPVAVWTIRTEKDDVYARKHFDMFIFEKFS